MSVHSTSFPTDQLVPSGAAAEALLPTAAAQPLAAKKFNVRKLLLTGAALATLAGAAWYGWDYWTVGQYLVSTDDAYVKADSTTIAPKVTGYLLKVLVKDNERVTIGKCWRGSTTATSESRSIRPRRMWQRPAPRSPASRPSSTSSRR